MAELLMNDEALFLTPTVLPPLPPCPTSPSPPPHLVVQGQVLAG